jgi:hypothetical protein
MQSGVAALHMPCATCCSLAIAVTLVKSSCLMVVTFLVVCLMHYHRCCVLVSWYLVPCNELSLLSYFAPLFLPCGCAPLLAPFADSSLLFFLLLQSRTLRQLGSCLVVATAATSAGLLHLCTPWKARHHILL